MSFTVADFHDLVRLLEEKPEWRADLRRFVLTDELLAVPEHIARLRQDTEQRFQALSSEVTALATAQQRTEARLSELAVAQQQTEARLSELAVAQQQTEARISTLASAQERTEAQLATLTGQVSELTQAMQTLTGRVGSLHGESLEQRYRTRGPAYFSRLLRGTHVLSSDELVSLVERAEEQGTLSDAEAQEIYDANLVVHGRRRPDGAPVYLVVEVSVGVGTHDVERAVRRATLLTRTGVTALPVVAGNWVTPEATEAARAYQVWQLTDGRVIAPSADTSQD